MGKLEESKAILKALGMPKQQQNDRSAYTLLALARLNNDSEWSSATNRDMRIVEIMSFMATKYGKEYKPNTRETIRKDTIHQFCDGAITVRNVGNGKRATNSPRYSYRLTNEVLEVIKAYGTEQWKGKLDKFLANNETLIQKYEQSREMNLVPVQINSEAFHFSPGKHNQLQKAIIEEFAPRFAPGSEVLYVGDTVEKDLVKNRGKLSELGILMTDHDKLPDVVLYRPDKDWLYFVESVTSVGPISVKRVNEIGTMLENCRCGVIYVTAFLDMSSNGFKKYIEDIAWETEIWIAEFPDHMIHMNGDRFIGPR
jgi:hypothetical protein